MSQLKRPLDIAEGYAKQLNEVELTDIVCIDKLDTIFKAFINEATVDYNTAIDPILGNVIAIRLSALYYEIKNTK